MLYMLYIILYSKILMPLTSSSLRFYHPFCTLVWMLMAGWHHKPSLNDINIKEWWKIGTISFRDESSEAVTAFSLLLALKDTDDAENKHCDGNRIWSKMKSQYDQNSNRIGPNCNGTWSKTMPNRITATWAFDIWCLLMATLTSHKFQRWEHLELLITSLCHDMLRQCRYVLQINIQI